MKKKSIIILSLVIFLTFMIYVKTRDTDVYYLNLGDEYLKLDGMDYATIITNKLKKEAKLEKFIEFKYDDYRVTDLLNTIRNNDYIYVNDKKQTVQNALIKADITTIWVGTNDFKYGLLKENKEDIYNYMDTLILDIESLLTEVRTFTKEEVFFIGYYVDDKNKKQFAQYLNNKVEKICKNKDIHFIKIDDLLVNNNYRNLYNKIGYSILDKFTFS